MHARGPPAGSGELARILEPYNLHAHATKGHQSGGREAFMMLKGGNLHGLTNPADVPTSLFMFGGRG